MIYIHVCQFRHYSKINLILQKPRDNVFNAIYFCFWHFNYYVLVTVDCHFKISQFSLILESSFALQRTILYIKLTKPFCSSVPERSALWQRPLTVLNFNNFITIWYDKAHFGFRQMYEISFIPIGISFL